MPLYEYRCERCGEAFEKLVRSFSAAGEVVCPTCGSSSVRRLVSLFGLGSRGGDGGSCAPSPAGG